MINSAGFGSEPPPLIKCLGEEELLIHKSKQAGPLYNLNQWIIGVVVRQDIRIKKGYEQEICADENFSPSVSFLRLVLLRQKEIFVRKNAFLLDSLIYQLPFLFVGYLVQLQALTPKAGCLAEKSTDVKYFLDRINYLQNELSVSELLEEKERIVRIFEKLKKFDEIVKSCEKEISKSPDNKNLNNSGAI
ncbi:MAG: hypothetical protein OXB84_01190 [Halobacteriovoraceae bacterium]|nr:hypothetical protein [Halobacteriovoraceae bacterium]